MQDLAAFPCAMGQCLHVHDRGVAGVFMQQPHEGVVVWKSLVYVHVRPGSIRCLDVVEISSLKMSNEARLRN